MHINVFDPGTWTKQLQVTVNNIGYKVGELKFIGKCSSGQVKVDINWQYLCRDNITGSPNVTIYDTYDRDVSGKEVIYPYYSERSIDNANALLDDEYNIPRYQTSHFKPPLTWTEDPYNDEYWRYNFYSLRFTKDLLNAAYDTHDPKYAKKLVEIIDSFDNVGINQPTAWSDPHAVAWRSMTYSDIWWKLRSINQLPISTSNAMLDVMERQGKYLADPAHYEAQYNHGTNEAAALYQLAVSFPTLPNANSWLETGKQRISVGLTSIFDKDGALVEHSPYYDYYALVKYWDVYTYSNRYNVIVSNDYKEKITNMINYAAYILGPDNSVPIVGSSLKSQINNSEEYKEISDFNKTFQYAITQGAKGTKPKLNSVQFDTTGQSILRSSWNSKPYNEQSQLIFNYGSYITNHSQLDNLSLELYGGGTQLITGPGLYTYEDNNYHDYFYGTHSQNTVLVDGQNQNQGTGYATPLEQTSDYSSQSATNQLNPNVTQERQVIMLGANLILVLDKLHATDNKIHTYQQQFNIAPGLKYSSNGLTAHAIGTNADQQLTIKQLSAGNTTLSTNYNNNTPNNLSGVCSQEYGKLIPCYQPVYTQQAKDATFVTALQIGSDSTKMTYSYDSATATVTVHQDNKTYTVNVNEQSGHNISATATNTAVTQPSVTKSISTATASDWSTTSGTLQKTNDTYSAGNSTLELTSKDGKSASTSKNVALDLSNDNLLLHLKIPSSNSVSSADITLSSHNSTATLRLKNAYSSLRDNDTGTSSDSNEDTNNGWSAITLGKGAERDQQGQWSIKGSDFEWSSINQITMTAAPTAEHEGTILFGGLAQIQGQTSAKVLIVFDDGSSTIKPAIDYMKSKNVSGSIAVIGKYVERNSNGYLTLDELKKYQQEGWSLVNHSYFHQDAITQYYDQNNMQGFENDLLLGAKYLEDNGISTDPNWYIYPHGTTNPEIQAIVGKYYKFARTELTAPEVYPFGNPLSVKDFIMEDSTSVASATKAINDAKQYNQTLILTFHRIHTSTNNESGYDYDKFKQIIDQLASDKVSVMSFNQFDNSNNTPINKISVTPAAPSTLNSSVDFKGPSLWQNIISLF